MIPHNHSLTLVENDDRQRIYIGEFSKLAKRDNEATDPARWPCHDRQLEGICGGQD